jgi:hypothetical protein
MATSRESGRTFGGEWDRASRRAQGGQAKRDRCATSILERWIHRSVARPSQSPRKTALSIHLWHHGRSAKTVNSGGQLAEGLRRRRRDVRPPRRQRCGSGAPGDGRRTFLSRKPAQRRLQTCGRRAQFRAEFIRNG